MFLVVVLAFSTLGSALLTFTYTSNLRKRQQLEQGVQTVNRAQMYLNALMNDSIEYSKKNPAITPLLQSVMQPAQAAPRSAK